MVRKRKRYSSYNEVLREDRKEVSGSSGEDEGKKKKMVVNKRFGFFVIHKEIRVIILQTRSIPYPVNMFS